LKLTLNGDFRLQISSRITELIWREFKRRIYIVKRRSGRTWHVLVLLPSIREFPPTNNRSGIQMRGWSAGYLRQEINSIVNPHSRTLYER